MSTATLPVELLIEIFELMMTNVGSEVGVSQLASQSSTTANANEQAALTESSNEDSDNEDSDDDDSNDDDDDHQKWDEGYIIHSSDDEPEDSGDWENSVEPTQSKEGDEQGLNAPGLLEMRRQGDGAVEWSALKTCRL